MSRVIHKKTLLMERREHIIEVPIRTKFISAENQRECLVIWYECDPDDLKVNRKIYTIETGKPVPENLSEFLGTVMFDNGNYVLHVYARINAEVD